MLNTEVFLLCNEAICELLIRISQLVLEHRSLFDVGIVSIPHLVSKQFLPNLHFFIVQKCHFVKVLVAASLVQVLGGHDGAQRLR
jgi:hypothetical protein